MSIETAVIPLAGAGTRLFPATTAIDKSMMPVYGGEQCRVLVDFMVEECARAEIKRIIFVTTERGETQLREYFDGSLNANLKNQLAVLDKFEVLEQELERRKSYGIEYEYVYQPQGLYGNAVPLLGAKPLLKDQEKFCFVGGDDFVYHADGTSELALGFETWAASGAKHIIMGNPVPREEASRYGVLQVGDNGQLLGIDEKPPQERVPQTPVVNISRYLLSKTIWEPFDEEMAQPKEPGQEYWFVDVVNRALRAGDVFKVHPVKGKYLDGGSPAGLLQASNYITTHPPIN